MACTSSTGTTAAPVTPRRKDDRSCFPLSGSLINVWYRVGGPGSTLIRSASMRRMTAPASNTGSGTTVAPAIRQAKIPALKPKVWKNGLTMR